jgi:hypothetical protein
MLLIVQYVIKFSILYCVTPFITSSDDGFCKKEGRKSEYSDRDTAKINNTWIADIFTEDVGYLRRKSSHHVLTKAGWLLSYIHSPEKLNT